MKHLHILLQIPTCKILNYFSNFFLIQSFKLIDLNRNLDLSFSFIFEIGVPYEDREIMGDSPPFVPIFWNESAC